MSATPVPGTEPVSLAAGQDGRGAAQAPPSAPKPAAGFSAGWLQQREPFDAEARCAAAGRLQLEACLARLRPRGGAPWRVIDLACGTGSNLRWLAPRMGGAQEWLVVDHDAALLRRWPQALDAAAADLAVRTGPVPRGPGRFQGRTLLLQGAGFDAAVVRQRLDLAQNLDRLPWRSAGLVTASALLDLVGASWLQQLVAAAADAGTALLMALSVDGRHTWTPADPDDGAVCALFAAHQRRDKGFGGAALGAAAVPVLVEALRASGYRVLSARSDWRVDGASGDAALAMHRAMVQGLSAAALEQAPSAAAAARVRDWRRRRLALAPRSLLRVGHVDVLALPPETAEGLVPRSPEPGGPCSGLNRARARTPRWPPRAR